jgi:hypothetical protein
MRRRRAACGSKTVITPIGVSVNTPRLHITSFAGHMVNLICAFIDLGTNKPLDGFTIRLISGFVHHLTSIHLIILVGLVIVQ